MQAGADLPLRGVAWVVGALALAVAPHCVRVPLWVVFIFGLFAIWRVQGARGAWPLPDRRHRLLLMVKQITAIVMFLVVLGSFGGKLGRDAGVALLIVLIGLKLLEMKSERDYYLVTVLGFFVVITDFLYDQEIATAVYLACVAVVLTACLIVFNDRLGSIPAIACLRLSGRMLAQALPLAAAMFLLFPRLPGPLWGLPRDAGSAVSGLSEEMTPGSLSQLGLSDEIAFRVEFDGALPKPEALYWRGPVLWDTDGRTWTAGVWGRGLPVAVEAAKPAVRYTVTLEPHGKRWLFALEMPTNTPAVSRVTADFRLLARSRIDDRIRYTVISHPNYRILSASETEIEAARALPDGAHPRARALAREWLGEARDARALIDRALGYFNQAPFYYTLRPPLVSGDTVDGFLLESRRGFCEHYAAAFTVLMRAAGIPARIVTGYQGGEFNPLGDYLIVRQRDAHAWVEVWLQPEGWVRVDPTAAVAPARVEFGIDNVLPREGGALALALQENLMFQRAVTRMRNIWDAANNSWNQWVLGYGPERQYALLASLGVEDPDWLDLGIWLSVALGGLLLAIAAWMFLDRHHSADPVRRLYDRFCAKLARRGITRRGHEGPLDFAARAAALRQDLAGSIGLVTDLYVTARYSARPVETAALERAVKRFRA
jgi:transglutaminase-like putative cysteine protease